MVNDNKWLLHTSKTIYYKNLLSLITQFARNKETQQENLNIAHNLTRSMRFIKKK